MQAVSLFDNLVKRAANTEEEDPYVKVVKQREEHENEKQDHSMSRFLHKKKKDPWAHVGFAHRAEDPGRWGRMELTSEMSA